MMDWESVACAAAWRPKLWASSTMAVSSSTLNEGRPLTDVRVLPPLAVIFMKSTLSLISWRTAATHSTGPVAWMPK